MIDVKNRRRWACDDNIERGPRCRSISKREGTEQQRSGDARHRCLVRHETDELGVSHWRWQTVRTRAANSISRVRRRSARVRCAERSCSFACHFRRTRCSMASKMYSQSWDKQSNDRTREALLRCSTPRGVSRRRRAGSRRADRRRLPRRSVPDTVRRRRTRWGARSARCLPRSARGRYCCGHTRRPTDGHRPAMAESLAARGYQNASSARCSTASAWSTKKLRSRGATPRSPRSPTDTRRQHQQPPCTPLLRRVPETGYRPPRTGRHPPRHNEQLLLQGQVARCDEG